MTDRQKITYIQNEDKRRTRPNPNRKPQVARPTLKSEIADMTRRVDALHNSMFETVTVETDDIEQAVDLAIADLDKSDDEIIAEETAFAFGLRAPETAKQSARRKTWV
jgi:hypothetical protein